MRVGVLFSIKDLNFQGKFLEKTKEAYSVFARLAKEEGIELFLSNFNEYFDGKLKNAFAFKEGWYEVKDVHIDAVFDRMVSNPSTEILKKQVQIPIINLPGLNTICWDKLTSYQMFPEFIPKTSVKIEDMNTEQVVIKPRRGIMGKGVEILNKEEAELNDTQVVQEFLDASSGIKELDIKGVHDLRVVVINGEIDHSYVRVAKRGSLFANCAQGGKKVYIDKIPKKIKDIVKKVDEKLDEFHPRVYSIDFMFDENQQPWIIELESIPGFAFYKGAEEIRDKFLRKILGLFLS